MKCIICNKENDTLFKELICDKCKEKNNISNDLSKDEISKYVNNLVIINGVKIDLNSLLKNHRVNSIEAAQELCAATGVTLKKAFQILENYEKGIPIGKTTKRVKKQNYKTICFIMLFLGLSFFISFIVDSFTDITSTNINITQHTWYSTSLYKDYKKTGFMIENNNDVAVNVTLTVECFDKNNNYIAKRESTVNALAPDSEYLLVANFSKEIDHVTYTFESKTSSYNPLSAKDLNLSYYSDNGFTYYVQATNPDSEPTSECNCTVIFYNSNSEIVDAVPIEIFNGHIPSGKTVEEKVGTAPILDKWNSIKLTPNVYTN